MQSAPPSFIDLMCIVTFFSQMTESKMLSIRTAISIILGIIGKLIPISLYPGALGIYALILLLSKANQDPSLL